MNSRQTEAQMAALDAGEFRFLRGKLLWSRIFPGFFQLGASDVVLNVGVGQGPQVLAYGGRFGFMVGVDVSQPSLQRSLTATRLCGITNYAAVCADAQHLPFRDGAFDHILAVDVISVVEQPAQLCAEVHRVLRPGGRMLMTFPGLQLRLRLAAARAGRFARRLGSLLGRRSVHQRRRPLPRMAPLADWLAIVVRHGFRLERSEATSIVPPLHWLGVSRFWFRHDSIYAADRQMSRLPGFRALGQAIMAVFTRTEGTAR